MRITDQIPVPHGGDPYRRAAAKIFKVPESEVTPDMRSQAKMCMMGHVYGATDQTLDEALKQGGFRHNENN